MVIIQLFSNLFRSFNAVGDIIASESVEYGRICNSLWVSSLRLLSNTWGKFTGREFGPSCVWRTNSSRTNYTSVLERCEMSKGMSTVKLLLCPLDTIFNFNWNNSCWLILIFVILLLFSHHAHQICTRTYTGGNDESERRMMTLKKGMSLNYVHNWIVDNMPVTWCYAYDERIQKSFCVTGFPMGCYFRPHSEGVSN